VGAVARDANGHLAAATSTGGMTNQLPGRVGDTPLIGCGSWADDATCAVSGTGHGEAFIRCGFAHEVDALIRLRELPIDEACQSALSRVTALGSTGGCIAVGPAGPAFLAFTTIGMYRGWIGEGGELHVAIFADE
jgi:beta-aspartyl-peptidase (threonine type)